MLKTLLYGTGNYKRWKNGSFNEFEHITYFSNEIAVVNHLDKWFELHSCGYAGYRSTTRALNDLEKYYKNAGYKLIVRD